MKYLDFVVGGEFRTATGRWRCTDIGNRVIVAIKIDEDRDRSWSLGPPYAVAESAFDEYDFGGCWQAPEER